MALVTLAFLGSPPLQAGDCRAVVQANYAAAQYAYVPHGAAYRQVSYAPYSYQVALVAVEQPYYSVDLLAPELRAKQRLKDQAVEIEGIKEVSRQNAEAIRLLYQLQSGKTGANEPLAMQSEDAKVVGILKQRCAACHTGDGAKGSPPQKFFEANGAAVAFTPSQKFLIESVVNDNSMPPAGNKLSADEYGAIRKWFESDRANVRAALKAAAKAPRE